MTNAHRSGAAAPVPERQTSPRVVDRALLLDPGAFGDALRPLLECVRSLVLEDADLGTRAALESVDGPNRASEVTWARSLLEARPSAAERSDQPYLECVDGHVLVGLTRPLPCADQRAALRLWREGAALERCVPMRRFGGTKDPSAPPPVRERLAEVSRGHAQCWWGQAPDGPGEAHAAVAEIFPQPSGFLNAMLVAHRGVGRIVVRVPAGPRGARGHALLASGWTSAMRSPDNAAGVRGFPHGGPAPATAVHVPDADLFALCAAMTWTPSLADAAWLAARDERLALR